MRGNAVNGGIVHDDLMSTLHNVITPKDLASEIGHTDEGKKVRGYLRKTYPGHFKNQRWELTPEMAVDAKAHFRGRSS